MQNYIIDPSVFYWINVMGILQTVCAIFGGLLLFGAICFLITGIYNYIEMKNGYDSNEECVKLCKKFVRILLLIAIVLIMISIFIPGKSTCVEMLVAKTATFENVDWSVTQVKEIVDYIVKALQSV